ncbi:prephenate dehydratase [Allostreptomyces psammosilenae]|uniref:Prephenate dehydratase n=1 Tax=Allostreptomyces psammosilenae TaxID=1892865 RepID=A0A852ZSV3_9ACTN|nr:prephenate dehydratase [Allostreptomyces psammosilenae]NYI05483.1 prephenate dehydratase [Allostreptomyces psammosilenae]
MDASRYTYLGPEGTFTEAALRTLPEAATRVLVPAVSVPAALDAVRRREADAAMVPMENSVEGSVPVTLDELATGEPLMIVREVFLPISFALMARPGTTLADVKSVTGHPHAQPQVRRWLAANLPDAVWESAASNADGARQVRDGRFDAAFAGEFAAAQYGLAVLERDVRDVESAVTRFVLVGRPSRPPAPTGADRTSLVAYLKADHPGALLEMLQEFAVRGVNMTRIESRPTGDRLGRYFFSIDCDGHVSEARIAEAMMGLHRVCPEVRFLGSYPRAAFPGAATVVTDAPRPGTTEADFAAAATWLTRCLDGSF